MYRQIILPTVGVFLMLTTIRTNNKNTCTSYLDYFLINFSGNCYYNPDVDLNIPQLIDKYTGNLKIYNVTTEDGYVLSLFRICKENPVGVIILQPPISGGSTIWLSDGNQSIAFALWNIGYDIWLTNHRGIPYSRKHTNVTDLDSHYWNFSFHEIALYDFTAQFDLIRNETKDSQVIFIGYSLSATEALIYASLRTEDARRFVKSFILVAPVSVISQLTISPAKILIYLTSRLEYVLGYGEFLSLEALRTICNSFTLTPYLMNTFFSIIMGWESSGIDPIMYPFIIPHHGKYMSRKIYYHYGQLIASGVFSMYDYGKESNNIFYGSETPPEYPLHNIITPTHFIYGDSDRVTPPSDVEYLYKELLPKNIVLEHVPIPGCNHVDFFFNAAKRETFYKHVLQIVNKIENS